MHNYVSLWHSPRDTRSCKIMYLYGTHSKLGIQSMSALNRAPQTWSVWKPAISSFQITTVVTQQKFSLATQGRRKSQKPPQSRARCRHLHSVSKDVYCVNQTRLCKHKKIRVYINSYHHTIIMPKLRLRPKATVGVCLCPPTSMEGRCVPLPSNKHVEGRCASALSRKHRG